MRKAAAYRHGVLCDFCFSLFHQVSCNFCRNLVNPPKASYQNRGPGLFPCPKYPPAKPYPWNFQGLCKGRNTIEKGHFNNAQTTTLRRQLPFSWYPRGSRISDAWRPQACKFCFELICGWRNNAQARREEWDQIFAKGPGARCSGLEAKKKRLKKWEETANTKIQHIHFYSNAGANVAVAELIPDWDHSGCVNCTFICKSVKYLNDAFPGLRSVIEQRNKHHFEYASGDGNQGRIPGQYYLMRCEVGKGSGWSYNKCLPAYSKESNQKFSAALKVAKWLGEEEPEKQCEFIDYYNDLPERINRIKNGDIIALYERETQDYYKYDAIIQKLRTYYKFPVTIERSHCETCHVSRVFVLLEDESTLGNWPRAS